MNTGQPRILIVDDVADNRDLLTRRLQRDGRRTAEAVNGREALNLMRADRFDLVLLDIMMPEMDGYEVLRQMKRDARLQRIPVIVISALDEVDSVVRCIELGADDYVTKPFDRVILNARVSALLERKRLSDIEQEHLRMIEEERRRSDELLRVILPEAVAEELKSTGRFEPRNLENVAVLFADVEGFTAYCDGRSPAEILDLLQDLVCEFEKIAVRHGLEKIKTMGDCFMAAAGLLHDSENPVRDCVESGAEMIRVVDKTSTPWTLRVGIHLGPVSAGIVGQRRYCFDIWGDTVNTAFRIEELGASRSVNLSADAWAPVSDLYEAAENLTVTAKGKGQLEITVLRP